MTNITAKTPIMIDFAPIGGGGNPRWAWVLGWFIAVKDCIDCILIHFNNVNIVKSNNLITHQKKFDSG